MFLAQMPTPQLPPLPDGPALDRVRGSIEIPTYEPWQIALFIVVGMIAVALIMWTIIALTRKQSGRKKALSPDLVALAEIETASTLADHDDERFAILCSGAIRRYFESALGIAAKGRTSQEFLRSLKGNTQLDADYQNQLKDFFMQCDGIKFARQATRSEQRAALSASAQSLIQKAEATKEATQP